MLVAAAAAGVTLALGTPLGGVVFSIETSSSIYVVSNIWKSFFTAVICIFTSKMVSSATNLEIYDLESDVSKPVSLQYEAILFAVLGILGGIIGALLSILISNISYIRKKSKNKFLNNRFRYAILVSVTVALCTFIISPLRGNHRKTLNILFAPNKVFKNTSFLPNGDLNLSSLDNTIKLILNNTVVEGNRTLINTTNTNTAYTTNTSLNVNDNSLPSYLNDQLYSNNIGSLLHPNEGLNLFIAFIVKFFITVISQTVNSPMGLFGPFFLIGALFGRLFGHFVRIIFGMKEEYIYSMVGAACVMSGSTHSVASAIIVFEITGQTSYLVPLLFSSLIANLVGQSLSMSIFDVLLSIKNLPHLPSIKSSKLYSLSAKGIQSKIMFYMRLGDEKKDDINNNINLNNTTKKIIPIIASDSFISENFDKNSMVFVNTNQLNINSTSHGTCNIISAMGLLINMPKHYYLTIPIIDSNRTIKYTVSPKNLWRYVFKEYESSKSKYSLCLQSNFNEFFDYTRKKFFNTKHSLLEQVIHKLKKLYDNFRDKEKFKLNKFYEEEAIKRILAIFKESAAGDTYLSKNINLDDYSLYLDTSALTVDVNFPVLKLQFLFTFLNISHIYVTEKGQLVGIISKEEFISKSMII